MNHWRSRRIAILWLLLALFSIGLAGCSSGDGAEPLSPTAVEALAPTGTGAPSPVAEPVGWQPFPTPPTAPAVVEVIELPGPPAPGLQPEAIALLGDRAYAANAETQNLSIIQDGAVRAVLPLDEGRYHLVADPARQQLYVLNRFGQSVTVVAGQEAIGQWPVQGEPAAGVVVGEHLWIGLVSGEIVRLDTATGQPVEPAPAAVDGMVQGLALAGERVLVGAHREIALYDTKSLQAVARQPLSGYRAWAVASTTLYLITDDLETGASWLERWDIATLSPLDRLGAPDDTGAIWADGERGLAVLAGATSHRLYLLDLRAGTVVHEIVTGLGPRQMAHDSATDQLYITHAESHTVAVVSAADLDLLDIVPLALQITALTPGPEPGSLLVGLNSGEIRLIRREAPSATLQDPVVWRVGVYPGEIAYLPALDHTAVLDRALGELLLVDRQGAVARRYATGPDPRGLHVDAVNHHLYAGDLRLDWAADETEALQIPAGLAETSPPIGVLRDTRRDRLYAVAWNGIPGSNGGYEITRWADGAWDPALPAPGRLSVADAVYDERTDRFFTTYAHMGQYGLQVADGETAAELEYLVLESYPQALALHPGLWHIYLVLRPDAMGPDAIELMPAHTSVRILDTRTPATLSVVDIFDPIGRVAVDPSTHRLYLAHSDEARIYVVQDVALAGPSEAAAPVATPTAMPSLSASATPTETAAPTATAAPAATAAPTVTAAPTAPAVPTATAVPTAAPTVACADAVHPALRTAWQTAGPALLGCPQGAAIASPWGWQPFQHGEMFWFSETRQILVVYDDGTWTYVPDRWRDGMPDLGCEATPPSGLWQPIRGFGLAWCNEPGVRDGLGWALDSEEAFNSVYQAFDGGSLVTHPEGGAFWLNRDGTHFRVPPPALP